MKTLVSLLVLAVGIALCYGAFWTGWTDNSRVVMFIMDLVPSASYRWGLVAGIIGGIGASMAISVLTRIRVN